MASTHPLRVMSFITLRTVCHNVSMSSSYINRFSKLQMNPQQDQGLQTPSPTMIQMQPLKRRELQVNLGGEAVSDCTIYIWYWILCYSHLLPRILKLPVQVVWFFGSIPSCPYCSPFHNVRVRWRPGHHLWKVGGWKICWQPSSLTPSRTLDTELLKPSTFSTSMLHISETDRQSTKGTRFWWTGIPMSWIR